MAEVYTEAGFHKKYSISGFQISQARRVCEFFFGDFFVNAKLDRENLRFDIQLHKEININHSITVKPETVERIIALHKLGINPQEISSTIKKESTFNKLTPVQEYIDLWDFHNYWGPQWRLCYEVEQE